MDININDEREIRIRKIEDLNKLSIASFPASSEREIDIATALDTDEGTKVSVAGRIMSKREMGKLVFCHLQDESAKIQVVGKQDELGKDLFKLFTKKIDVADFVDISGERFVTKKGEQSILIKSFKLLTKAVRPLPDKFHGITDEELRLRKRYLDILLNPELKELFRKKNIFWSSIREFLTSEGFVEVETPVLETSAGGADAAPFITHHNALDLDVYLRISMGELWQKRLMVAGFEKTFEIGRQFRNEGMSREHLQDYTQMEFYWAYADYNKSMDLVEKMYKFVVEKTFGTLKFNIGEFKDIDFGQKWQHIDYVDEIKKQLGIDVLSVEQDAMVSKLKELKMDHDKSMSKGRLIDSLWKYCRKNIKGPAFLVNHPVSVSPLAKRKKDQPELTERYQIMIAGSELGNGYSELNDPIDQAGRFQEQAKMREEGDAEAQMHDHDFVEALEHGMPPTTGFGLSERLFSFLADKPIRECVLFPLMKPEGHTEKTAKRSRKTMAAHVIVLADNKRENWTKLNAIAHLNASFGARTGKELFYFEKTHSEDGVDFAMNTQHAILIKQTDNQEDLHDLKTNAEEYGLQVECFTQDMQETTNDLKVCKSHESKKWQDIELLGILLYGEKKEVEKLTEEFKLAS